MVKAKAQPSVPMVIMSSTPEDARDVRIGNAVGECAVARICMWKRMAPLASCQKREGIR